MASAVRSEVAARSSPTEKTTTSPVCFSLMRSASSTANSSYGLITKVTPVSSKERPSAAILTFVSVSGTCLMQTAIFTASSLPPRGAGVLLEEQRGVGPAEAEGVVQRHLDRLLAGLVRDVVEIALRIGRLVVDGRRHDVARDRQRRDGRLQAAGRPQQVAGHRLGRAHGQ